MKNVRDLLARYSLPAGWQASIRLPAGWLGTRDGPPPSTVPLRHHAWVAAGPHNSQQAMNRPCTVSASNQEHEFRAEMGSVLCVKPLLKHNIQLPVMTVSL